jgi:hypothetical protein
MMPKHVLAFVEWNEFRRGGRTSRPERSFFYALAVPHLHERVGNGGTLWVITRRPGTRRYSLAYKLVNCRVQNDVPVYIQQAYGSSSKKGGHAAPLKKRELQLVVSHDWEACEHYPENDVTDVLLRLEFVTGKPMRECRNIGTKILYVKGSERGQVCSWLLSSCRGRCRQIDLPPTHGEARKGKGAVTAIISHLAETPTAVRDPASTLIPVWPLAPRPRWAPSARRSPGRRIG